MEKTVLTQFDFENQGRSINLQGFTNLQKGITELDLADQYPVSQFQRFSKAGVDKLMQDIVQKANEADEIEKALESDELEKGGEGSKGGHVIGHTKSGKPIYAKDLKKLLKKKLDEDPSLVAHLHGLNSEINKSQDFLTSQEILEQGKQLLSNLQPVNVIIKGEAQTFYVMPNDIEKGGEGSRGGKVIGHTKSGKPIYDKFNHSGHKKFDYWDHFDAKDAHYDNQGKLKEGRSDDEASKHKKEAIKLSKISSEEFGRKHFMKKSQETDIEKGEISEALGYGTKISKTGKEISEKIDALKVRVKTKLDTLISEKAAILKQLGNVQPTQELDNWDTRGLPDDVAKNTKRFNWEMCYFHDSGAQTVGAMPEFDISATQKTPVKAQVMSAGSKSQAELCRSYNQKVSACLDCYRDLNKAELFQRNVDAKKSYELSLNELDALGF